MSDYASMISLAAKDAAMAHAGQTDKAGRPYIMHVVRVAAAVETDLQAVVALLHDIMEDTEHMTWGQLQDNYGSAVVDAVDAITRTKGEPYCNYLDRVKDNRTALAVKIADIKDNMRADRLALLPETDRVRLTEKYAKSLAFLEDCPKQ